MIRAFAKVTFILVVFLMALPARAQLIVYDTFDYTVGEPIIGKVNPSTSAAWFEPTSPAQPAPEVDPQVVVSGNIDYPGLQTGEGNSLLLADEWQSNIARLRIPRPGTDGSFNINNTGADGLFFSFTMKMTNFNETIGAPDTPDVGGGFLAGFHSGPFDSGTQGGMQTAASYGGQVRVRQEVAEGVLTGDYEIGVVVNNSAGVNPPTDWHTDQSFGVDEPVLIVGSYVFNGGSGDDDVVNLWINPTPGVAAPTPTIVTDEGVDVQLAGFYTIRSFWFRSDEIFFPGDFAVDELRIGQTFADVTPAAGNGDFNEDGFVDGADYVAWRKNVAGGYTEDDYMDWRTNFGTDLGGGGSGAVPEPSTVVIMLFAAASVFAKVPALVGC